MKVWGREEAAEFLACHVTGVSGQDLLDDQGLVDVALGRALQGHVTCGCEHAVRLQAAAVVLTGGAVSVGMQQVMW